MIDPRMAGAAFWRHQDGRPPFPRQRRRVWAQVVDEITRRYGGARILDVGAGTGEFARLAASQDHDVVEVDVLPAPGRVVAMMEHLPFRDGAFDVVLFSASLHHASDVPAVVHEAARLLASRGALVVCLSPFHPTEEAASAATMHQRNRWTHDAPALARVYRHLCYDSVLQPVSSAGLGCQWHPPRFSSGFTLRRRLKTFLLGERAARFPVLFARRPS